MISCNAISNTDAVDAHLLRTFVTVARLGSFSAAAAELRYTQAAVSQQIAALESDLKVTLLNRRPVSVTEAGARLLEHAAPILLRLDAARADVMRMTSAPSASLVVGMTPLAGADVVGSALAALRRRLPRLAITVQTATRQLVAEGVARGELDLGLTDGLAAPSDPLPDPAPLSAAGIAEDQVTVLLPAGHPLARRAALALTDLVDARWIEAPGVAPALADVRRAAGTEGFRSAFRYDGTDSGTLIRLAASGHGLTLLPAAMAAVLPATVAAVPIGSPRLVHRVELVHGSLPADSPASVLTILLSRD
jgi:DNA-binding transcriptional LysR family regulator